MSIQFTQVISENIKRLREEKGMSQQDLADKVNIARPTISKWENGGSEPSSSQLGLLAKIFDVSSEVLLGNADKPTMNVIVVDTSVFIKRPIVLNDLLKIFDEIIIPEIVIGELNHIKDTNKKSGLSQKAWLCLVSIDKLKDNPKIHITQSRYVENQENDKRIAEEAKARARKSVYDKVYMYSDDIYFQFLVPDISNLEVLTPRKYDEKFGSNNVEYDVYDTQNFFSAVKAKNIQEVETFNFDKIDVNRVDNASGQTALIMAVRNRDIKMAEFLIEKIPTIDLEVRDKQKYEFTALLHTCQMKDVNMMKLLLSKGADVNTCGMGVNHGNTPLMVCAWDGFTDGVKLIMEQNVSYNQQDNNGFTALHKACKKDKHSVAKLLIDYTDLRIRDREHKLAKELINPNGVNGRALLELFRVKEGVK